MEKDPRHMLLRSIPSVDRVLAEPELAPLRERYAEEIVKRAVRRSLDLLREEILHERAGESDCDTAAILGRISRYLDEQLGPKLKTVINATGVVVHTNLGRAPLSDRVVNRIAEIARTYSNLEYDLAEGSRGERNSHLRTLIEELTGAEAAIAVNNNAAAVLLALSTLASGREVVVSRGELIEIGGSFRIPDVMAQSGAILREVGTTNRTHPKDYVQAINERTALILKVHPSNYQVVGFTREVSLEDLVAIARESGIPCMMDLGSGCLMDLSRYGLPGETTVQEALALGVDVVTFSGDKLLGGPQAGIITGRRDLVERMRKNQLARALRLDKLTMAALEATIEEYTRPDGGLSGIPVAEMISRSPQKLQKAAESLAEALRRRLGEQARISVEQGVGRVGGGSLPMGELHGPRVVIRPTGVSAARMEKGLRLGRPPVIAMVREDAVLLDPRTLLQDQAGLIPELAAQALTVA
ncbi:MAG: L-seryl-tRNA(Sec) selenium transferase [Thermodesulfobacteriota bacterium]